MDASTTSTSISELNAQTDHALTAKAGLAAVAAAPKVAPAKRAPRAKKVVAPVTPVAPVRKVRKAMTPSERAAKPVTATIASYVEWLQSPRGIGAKKFASLSRKDLAGIAITLYGAYQVSDERKLARDGHK